MELMFIYNLRRQLENTKVEDVGSFPIIVSVTEEEAKDGMMQLNTIIDGMKDALEAVHDKKLLGIDEVWVTHIENDFNPYTFDINGKTYFCVQNMKEDAFEKFTQE